MQINQAHATSKLSAAATPLSKPMESMGEQDFLKLLVAQLKNQDPLQPMEDKEFMAQLAQFSTLDQITSMNASLSAFTSNSLMTQASTFLGKEIEGLGNDGPMRGMVTGVSVVEGITVLEVGKEKILASTVSRVSLPKTSGAASA